MKTLIDLRMAKERKECWNQSGNASETETQAEERGGSAADIKFQPRRVTQNCPRPSQTRRVERVLVETRVLDTDKDCRGTRWGAPSSTPPADPDWPRGSYKGKK